MFDGFLDDTAVLLDVQSLIGSEAKLAVIQDNIYSVTSQEWDEENEFVNLPEQLVIEKKDNKYYLVGIENSNGERSYTVSLLEEKIEIRF